jgi:L-asparaginase II
MLAAAAEAGLPVDSYVDPAHPVQRAILGVVSRFSGVPEAEIPVGVDGCSAPIFALPVRAQALMYARLVAPDGLSPEETAGARRVAAAMVAHPEMVAATVGRLDTDLMRAAPGRVIAKAGAEGVHCLGIFPCPDYPEGLGVALKIYDGDPSSRARNPVVAEIVRQLLGVELPAYAAGPLRNHRGTTVGVLKTVFDLKEA